MLSFPFYPAKRKNTQLALYPDAQLQDEIHISIPHHQSSLILILILMKN